MGAGCLVEMNSSLIFGREAAQSIFFNKLKEVSE